MVHSSDRGREDMLLSILESRSLFLVLPTLSDPASTPKQGQRFLMSFSPEHYAMLMSVCSGIHTIKTGSLTTARSVLCI